MYTSETRRSINKSLSLLPVVLFCVCVFFFQKFLGGRGRYPFTFFWAHLVWLYLPISFVLTIVVQYIGYSMRIWPEPSAIVIKVSAGSIILMTVVHFWINLTSTNRITRKIDTILRKGDDHIVMPFILIGLSILIVYYFNRDLFKKGNIGFEEPQFIDDTPEPSTPEFDKRVLEGSLTVLPTQDRTLPASITQGSAHFVPDSRKEMATAKDPYRGLWLGGGFFHQREGNLLSVAAPGSGKGAALIIPNLLIDRNYKHSFLVFDPKGTNAAITARFQKERGQKVIILDPANIQALSNAKHGINPACFNPLDFIGTNIVKGCSQIANFLLPDDPKSTDKIWAMEARDLIQGVLMHIMTSPIYEGKRNLVSLYKLFRQSSWDDILNVMKLNKACEERIYETAKKMLDLKETSDRSFGSVVFSTGEAINWLKDPDLQAALQKSDFDPAEFGRGNITLYLCIPIDSVELYATWGRLVIGMILHANSRPSGAEKAWCYYLLDEFPTMGVFPEVIKALAFSREFKMRLWLFAQNLAQLDRIYTEAQRKEILGTCGVFQAFSVTEPTTASYVSERLGGLTAFYATESFTSGASSGQGSSTSVSSTKAYNQSQRSLLYANEVEREQNIITFSEIGTCRLKRWFYWQQPTNSLEKKYFDMMQSRADKNINYGD